MPKCECCCREFERDKVDLLDGGIYICFGCQEGQTARMKQEEEENKPNWTRESSENKES